MDNHQLIHQNSGVTDWYTPVPIIEAARSLMGGIDLDPASSVVANSRPGVQIPTIYTQADNGLSKPWHGRVWMNHPFARSERACGSSCSKKTCKKRGHCLTEDLAGNTEWISRLILAWKTGEIEQACCICFAAVNAEWFHPLLRFPQFFFLGRVEYETPTGEKANGVTKDSVFTWLPPHDFPGIATAVLSWNLRKFGYEGTAK